MTPDLHHLKEVAEGPICAEWEISDGSIWGPSAWHSHVRLLTAVHHSPMNGIDRAKILDHIATFDPPTVLALLSRLQAAEEALRAILKPGMWLFLDGRNEHGSHVLSVPGSTIDPPADDLNEYAERILTDAETKGFSIGEMVWAAFSWIAPEYGDEGRICNAGYWDFDGVDAETTRTASAYFAQPQTVREPGDGC